MTKRAKPAQETIKPVKARPSSESINERLVALCAAGDPAPLLAYLKRIGARPGSEVTHSKTPLEYAMEADAPACFQALIESSRAGGGSGLDTRLWGGQAPVHHCAFKPDPLRDEGGQSAPKCLAWILREDPLAAARADEEGRTALDWAAMAPDPTAFGILLASLARAREAGSIDAPAATRLAERASSYVVVAARNARAMMERLRALAQEGVDWRSARSASGQSVLGACCEANFAQFGRGAELGLALIEAGADPMSPYVERHRRNSKEGPGPSSCAELVLDLMWLATGLEAGAFARALAGRLSDEQFMAATEPHAELYEDQKWLGIVDQASGQGLGAHLGGRRRSIQEAGALESCAPQARQRGARPL